MKSHTFGTALQTCRVQRACLSLSWLIGFLRLFKEPVRSAIAFGWSPSRNWQQIETYGLPSEWVEAEARPEEYQVLIGESEH